MFRVALVAIGALALMLTACSSSVPSAPVSESASSTPVAAAPAVAESAGDAWLRVQKQKQENILREYENGRDPGDYARMMKWARARGAERQAVIGRVHKMKLNPEEHERILNPLRPERDRQLQVIQAASAM